MAGSMHLPKALNGKDNKLLFTARDAGDEDAREKIILGNMKLVMYQAKQFFSTSLPVDDLISIGTVGLMKAVDSFKLEKGFYFATYAARCISNEILMALRKTKKDFLLDSFEQPIGTSEGRDITRMDVIANKSISHFDEAIVYDDTLSEVFDILSTFSELEQEVVKLRYLENKTQREVATLLGGISQSYISRIEKKAIERIREVSEMRKQVTERATTKQTQKGEVIDMAKGNRVEAIRLLKNTRMSYVDIHKKTGVPEGSLGSLALQHRPASVRKELTINGKVTPEGRKPINYAQPKTPDTWDDSDFPVVDIPVSEYSHEQQKQELLNKVIAANTRAEIDSVAQETEEFLKAEKSIVEEPVVPAPIGFMDEFKRDYEAEIRAKIALEPLASITSEIQPSSLPQAPSVEEPKKGVINRKVSFSYSSDGSDVSTKELLEELESLAETIKNNGSNQVTFSLSVKAN